MYLKSLELVGFKSFAQKTLLEFHRGVTAIVGPNGCGKSNVLDAIRWVLGEQSAKALRGGEMADVIFGGTDSRSALGMAEVSLTFSECERELGTEWNEVCVSRRIFKDGKSEYLLNKTPCRLRDIHQLFMDTGIGRSAYSIMEQGKIDLILSSRPEDRRAIFEEAAGITKYKSQKKEALRKLEYTEANLLRVSDIIKEVRRQIGSLQRQAAKARRYQSLMQNLQVFDTHLSHRNYRQLDEERESIAAEQKKIDETHTLHQTQIESQEIELSDFRRQLSSLDEKVNETRDRGQTYRNRIFSAESRIQTNKERHEEFSDRIKRSEEEITSAEIKLREQESQIQKTDEAIQEILQVLSTEEGIVQSHETGLQDIRGQSEQAEQTVRDLSQKISEREGAISQLQQDILRIAARREATETRKTALQEELESIQSRRGQLEHQIKEASARIESTRSELLAAQTDNDESHYAYEEAQRVRQQADIDANAVTRAFAEQQSRLEVLRQLQEQGEGLGAGTQAVLRGLDQPDLFRSAIHGALAGLIEADSQYIPAIEAALGSNLQAIVFKDAEIAQVALNALRNGKLGRAVLAPQDWLPQQDLWQPGDLPGSALAWAIHCVTADNGVKTWLQHLLAYVVVVADLETAFKLHHQNLGLAIATLQGEFITRDGVIHGGQNGETSNSVLLRRTQIADLEQRVEDLQHQSITITARRSQAIEDLEGIQHRIREHREQLQRTQMTFAAAEGEKSLFERQYSETEGRLQFLQNETSQIHHFISGAEQETSQFENQIGELRICIEQMQSEHDRQRLRIKELKNKEDQLTEELNALRLRVATERQKRENLASQRQPMAVRLSELNELVAQRRTDVVASKGRIDALQSESSELENNISNWKQEMTAIEQEIQSIAAQRSEIHENVEALEASLRLSRKQISDLQEQRNRLDVRAAQIQMRLEALIENIQRRYQVNLSEFQPDSHALQCALKERQEKTEESGSVTERMDQQEQSISWENLEMLVGELTAKLDSMGPVNMDAIQEYDELEQRLQFLEQQNADLLNSKAELLDVIARINRTTKELFAETFEKIRINFQEMFSELFGGGRANLMLADESDPLECGIEIIAKPPGKQLQSISLLSGGERTMTAVALLFSIYMVKPSPFCVLDEMDAPLDESNINRFIKILDRFVDQSQFVVITHNKRTIARADMLYGVTMEEHGISKIVSVKFNKKEEPQTFRRNDSALSIAESFGKSPKLRSEETEGELIVDPSVDG